ncbi:MAG: hypothetical protein AAGC60_00355 [Acidobacteriota bacterium]
MSLFADLGNGLEAIHEDLPRWIADDAAARGIAPDDITSDRWWGDASKGLGAFPDADAYLEFLIWSTPSRFGEVFFREYDQLDTWGRPKPWRLFDYQRTAIDYIAAFAPAAPPQVVFQCGSETGKTRTIVLGAVYLATVFPGEQLIAAAYDSQVSGLHDALMQQVEGSDVLRRRILKRDTKLSPYKVVGIAGRDGASKCLLKFRPATKAIRSLHIGVAAWLDEAPDVTSRRVWDDFYARRLPGCRTIVSGVPNGQPSEYVELCERSPEVDPLAIPATSGFITLRWPKSMMPPPFWTPERDAELATKYGGRDSIGYLQNVLGLHGDPVESVHPWSSVQHCVESIDGYRSLELLHDEGADRLYLEAHRIREHLHIGASLADSELEIESTTPRIPIAREDLQLDALHVAESERHERVAGWIELLERYIEAPEGELVVGVDVGVQRDPTEILVARVDGARTTLVLRIQCRALGYTAQGDLLYALESILRPALGWGLDSTGGVGVGLVEQLLSSEQARVDGAAITLEHTGYLLNTTTQALGDDGRALEDEDGKPLKIGLKEAAVQAMERAISARRLRLPPDPVLLRQLTRYTARPGRHGRAFNPVQAPDHLVVALQVLHLRLRDQMRGHDDPWGLIALLQSGRSAPRGATARRTAPDVDGWRQAATQGATRRRMRPSARMLQELRDA